MIGKNEFGWSSVTLRNCAAPTSARQNALFRKAGESSATTRIEVERHWRILETKNPPVGILSGAELQNTEFPGRSRPRCSRSESGEAKSCQSEAAWLRNI